MPGGDPAARGQGGIWEFAGTPEGDAGIGRGASTVRSAWDDAGVDPCSAHGCCCRWINGPRASGFEAEFAHDDGAVGGSGFGWSDAATGGSGETGDETTGLLVRRRRQLRRRLGRARAHADSRSRAGARGVLLLARHHGRFGAAAAGLPVGPASGAPRQAQAAAALRMLDGFRPALAKVVLARLREEVAWRPELESQLAHQRRIEAMRRYVELSLGRQALLPEDIAERYALAEKLAPTVVD